MTDLMNQRGEALVRRSRTAPLLVIVKFPRVKQENVADCESRVAATFCVSLSTKESSVMLCATVMTGPRIVAFPCLHVYGFFAPLSEAIRFPLILWSVSQLSTSENMWFCNTVVVTICSSAV